MGDELMSTRQVDGERIEAMKVKKSEELMPLTKEQLKVIGGFVPEIALDLHEMEPTGRVDGASKIIQKGEPVDGSFRVNAYMDIEGVGEVAYEANSHTISPESSAANPTFKAEPLIRIELSFDSEADTGLVKEAVEKIVVDEVPEDYVLEQSVYQNSSGGPALEGPILEAGIEEYVKREDSGRRVTKSIEQSENGSHVTTLTRLGGHTRANTYKRQK